MDEPQPTSLPEREDRVLGAGALRALAHPMRVRIYDILSQYGAQTASSLADRLGESTGATSYHLRALAKQDLIREVDGRGTRRERWWERPVGGVTLTSPDVMRTPAGLAATQLVLGEWLRNRHEQLLRYVETEMPAAQQNEWRDSTMISTGNARLTPAQAAIVVAKLQAVIDEAVAEFRDQTGEDVRPVTIRADLFPLPAQEDSR